MRRSHPSSLDPKALSGLTFDVCSIASTETASTVAGRGRGGLRKRRGAGGAINEDDDGASISLYSDPLSSMFSPTSYTGGSSGLLGNRRTAASHISKGAMAMPPPDPRRSHGSLIGSKQGTHARTTSSHAGVQSVRVEISPTGSPSSPIPPSVTSNIKAPTINAFRRCLMIKGGGGGHITSPLTGSLPSQPSSGPNSLFLYEGQTAQFQGNGHFPQVEVTVTDDTVEVAVGRGDREDYPLNDEEGDMEVETETHIFLFDNDPDDDMAMTISSSPRGHTGGKERSTRKGLACKAAAPYGKGSSASGSGSGALMASASRRHRRACRSRYDIEEGEDDGDSGAAIYYVQVGHTALTPRDCPDDVVAVPQMPLLPSSIATAVVDEELAVLEELML